MKRYLVFIALFFIACAANAQDVLKGIVVEQGTNEKLTNVFVHNTSNKQITLVDKNGNFEIKGGKNHLIIFDSPGYVPDTLLVIDYTPLKIVLKPVGITLKQVDINASRRAFDPHVEYPEIYRKSKVYPLSPSTWFSKEGRDARRLKRFFEQEEQERYIDRYYTVTIVGNVVPLKGEELQNFMAIYRPTYAYVKSNNGPSLTLYINDSYQKYKVLPTEKKVLPGLK
ncbi:MAG: hypothetical protein H7289_06785 [Mucilaginibacter sp.]|nr:hypothetical protein [Mucilaginibacter sp.]